MTERSTGFWFCFDLLAPIVMLGFLIAAVVAGSWSAAAFAGGCLLLLSVSAFRKHGRQRGARIFKLRLSKAQMIALGILLFGPFGLAAALLSEEDKRLNLAMFLAIAVAMLAWTAWVIHREGWSGRKHRPR